MGRDNSKNGDRRKHRSSGATPTAPVFDNICEIAKSDLMAELHRAVDRLFEEPATDERAEYASRVAFELSKIVHLAMEAADIEVGRLMSGDPSVVGLGLPEMSSPRAIPLLLGGEFTCSTERPAPVQIDSWAATGFALRANFAALPADQQQLGLMALMSILGRYNKDGPFVSIR